MKQLLAALIFFTRLPFWRIANVDQRYYKRVVDYWTTVGWLTGGVMAGVLWLAGQVFSMPVTVIMAFTSRLLITGALHEDGLADFCDGFGGGTSRDRILSIMKDSHIGTYGVIGLIIYYLLTIGLISSLPLTAACIVLFTGDTWSKFCAGQIINVLPYARKEEEAKVKVIYDRMSRTTLCLTFIIGAMPCAALMPGYSRLAALAPAVTFVCLAALMRKKIQGYTGDCCGAMFLLCELSYYIVSTAILRLTC